MIITLMIMVIIFSGKACDRPHILGWASVRARGAVLTQDTHPKIYTVYIPTVYLPRYTQCISALCICQDIHCVYPHCVFAKIYTAVHCVFAKIHSVHPHYTTIHTQHCLKLKVICCVHVILMYTLCNINVH